MTTNNIFQNNQNNAMNNYSNNWNGRNNMGMNQNNFYNGGCVPRYEPSMVPVKVIYSVDQIMAYEVPTNGTPALFPFHDGSKIIARCLTPDGRFMDSVYVLENSNSSNDVRNDQNDNVNNELLKRIEILENNLDNLLKDLYGSKNQTNQEGENK